MGTEQSKALVRRAVEQVFNQGNLAVADEVFAPEYAEHERAFTRMIRSAFPNLVLRIELMIAEGDMIATHWVCEGTQAGAFMGLPPSGKRARWTGTWIQRVAGGKIVEGMSWGNWDAAGLMKQLGGEG
jgi:predicted ester cyclase